MSRGWTARRLALTLAAVLVAGNLAVTSSSGSDAQTPKRGGTAVIALPFEPGCLNVLPPCEFGWPAFQVLEGAFEIGPDFRYRRNLVSKVDVKEEPFTLTYHVLPSARWSDGVPVTASDFVFTFQAFRARAGEGDPLLRIRRLAVLDAKTFRVFFRSTFAGWRELFHVVLPRHALAGEDLSRIWQDRIDDPKTGEPIGSGPFLVERLERGRQLTLVRNERYWGPHTAYLKRVVFRFAQGDFEALRSGQLDLLFPNVAPDAEGVKAIRQGVIKVLLSPGVTWEHFAIRLDANAHPALGSRLVRRALAYGVNREAIVRAIYGLVAPRKGPLDSAVFPRQSRFYVPHWNVYRYRPAEARSLLERAKCARGADGIYVCGGERLSLRFLTTGGTPPRELTLRLAQKQLRRAGVEVVPEFAPSQALFLTLLEAGEGDVVLFGWAPGAGTDLSVDIFRCKGPSNHTGYCNRQVSRDLLRSRHILDPRRRAALFNRVDAQLASDVPVLPLFQASHPVALLPILRGVVPADPPDYLTWNSEDWWLAQ